MFKKICSDLLTILLPLILILTPRPTFAAEASLADGIRGVIGYWWVAPVALIPLMMILWPQEEPLTVYQSIRRSSKKKNKTTKTKKK